MSGSGAPASTMRPFSMTTRRHRQLVARIRGAEPERNTLRLGLPHVYTLMISGAVFVIWQGGEGVASGAMSVVEFVAYLALFIRFVERGFRIPQLVNSIQTGGSAYARLARRCWCLPSTWRVSRR
jgi:ABC-type multidrug transport system fused ATPase/permease subunit